MLGSIDQLPDRRPSGTGLLALVASLQIFSPMLPDRVIQRSLIESMGGSEGYSATEHRHLLRSNERVCIQSQ